MVFDLPIEIPSHEKSMDRFSGEPVSRRIEVVVTRVIERVRIGRKDRLQV